MDDALEDPWPAGEPQSGEAVFASLYPSLRRFAAVVADLDMDPDDLVQDALASTLKRYRIDELDHPAAYLKQAIVHTAANGRRNMGRLRAALPRLGRDPRSLDTYPSDLAILEQLASLDRAILYLADVEGESLTHIANVLGLTEAATRKRASRARKQLSQYLGTHLRSITGDLES